MFRISHVVQGFKNKARYIFSIVSKERNELIGEIGLHFVHTNRVAQLGYWVGEPFWNRGIATEAAGAALKFGFETLGLDLVFATCHVENPASANVLIKNGMSGGEANGNVVEFRLTKTEYFERQAQNG